MFLEKWKLFSIKSFNLNCKSFIADNSGENQTRIIKSMSDNILK